MSGKKAISTKQELKKNCMGIELSTKQYKKTAMDRFIKENDIDILKEKLKKTNVKLVFLYNHPRNDNSGKSSSEYLAEIEKLHIVRKKLEKVIQEDWLLGLKVLFGLGGMIGFFISGFILTCCFLIHGHGFLAFLTMVIGIVWFMTGQCMEKDETVNIFYISSPILAFLSTCIIYGMVGEVGIAAIPVVFICGVGTVISSIPAIAAIYIGMKVLG